MDIIERARAALRHKGPCTCFRTDPPENHCPDGLCGDAVDRIAAAITEACADQAKLSDTFTGAMCDVLSERARQIHQERYSIEHDDQHGHGELARAAGCYALWCSGFNPLADLLVWWPFERAAFKPKNYRRDLVRAAALLLAEIERYDRMPTPESMW